ncbi:hypothetical protein C4K28_5413 [Pseudomonas chlororaphis subsp. piscium]|nr:hypothetical protein C4K28_5413 [Pseudomonas chlororaphis subsp. piscium]
MTFLEIDGFYAVCVASGICLCFRFLAPCQPLYPAPECPICPA